MESTECENEVSYFMNHVAEKKKDSFTKTMFLTLIQKPLKPLK